MSYSHFTIEERISIKHLLAQDISIRHIAKEIGRSPSSVSREIKRNSRGPNEYGETYRVKLAEKLYKKRVSKAHNIVRFTSVIHSALGRKDLTRILTDFLESSFPKVII